MSKPTQIITAIGTPLDEEEELHQEGLRLHLADQWSAGIDGVLVGGTMGAMQMLRDGAYRSLIETAAAASRGAGEILVGVGDAGWARTRDRIEIASRYQVDGVVVLTPYLFRFSQQELVDYFTSLADASPLPVYLYDLPGLSRVSLEMETYRAVAKHPNIRGAKVSGRLDFARELLGSFGDSFRIIVAEPDKVDALLREGITAHLDGMFAIAPQWIMALAGAVSQGDWARAAAEQTKLNDLRNRLLEQPSVMGAFTVMMNARGIPGKFHGAPYASLSDERRAALLASSIMRELAAFRPAA